MKRSLLTLSITVGLATAASLALADDKVIITQTANNGQVNISQYASLGNNAVQINQGDGSGGPQGRNSVNVIQNAVADSSIKTSQTGSYNNYTIIQGDGRNLLAEVNTTANLGNYNNVSVEQYGLDASALVDQGTSSNSQARIVQFGSGGMNFASITQAGDGNSAAIGQAGSNLTASLYQTGVGNTAVISQGLRSQSN